MLLELLSKAIFFIFLCYIIDLPGKYHPVSVYLLLTGSCVGTTTDADKLQDDIDGLPKWDGVQPGHVRDDQQREEESRDLLLDPCNSTERVGGAKYRGATVARTLTWNDHITNITKKANNTRALLQRNTNSCPQSVTLPYLQ